MKQSAPILLVALAGCLSIGCGSSDAGVVKTAPVPVDQVIQRVENDKFMPADQKAAVIARLRSHPVPDKTTQ